MNKKSQGLSINVIIIVAIALIVLVVLIAVFTGRIGSFVAGVDSTATCKSNCESFGMIPSSQLLSECTRGEKERQVAGTYTDVVENDVCCCKPTTAIPVTESELCRRGCNNDVNSCLEEFCNTLADTYNVARCGDCGTIAGCIARRC
jgi:hypothetical protein